MLLNKEPKRLPASRAGLLFSIFALTIITSGYKSPNNSSQEIFCQNGADSFVIENYRYKNQVMYIINGNEKELFNRLNDRYFISNESIHFSNKNDIIIIKLSNYEFKILKGQIFIDGKEVGMVQNSDIIILHHDKKIVVYDKSKVRIIQKVECKK